MLTGHTRNRSDQQHKRPWRVAYVHQSIYLQANVQFCELRHTFKGAKYFESAMMKISATDGTWNPRAVAQDAQTDRYKENSTGPRSTYAQDVRKRSGSWMMQDAEF